MSTYAIEAFLPGGTPSTVLKAVLNTDPTDADTSGRRVEVNHEQLIAALDRFFVPCLVTRDDTTGALVTDCGGTLDGEYIPNFCPSCGHPSYKEKENP